VKELTSWSPHIGATLLTECLGLIHATTLRQSMQLKGTFTFNSNLRLFTTSRRSVPTSWICNILCAIFLISSYSSISLVFLSELSQPMVDSNDFSEDDQFRTLINKLHVSGITMVTLGGGLFGQALLATGHMVQSMCLPEAQAPLIPPLHANRRA
jgi:hypothetical protein